MFSTEHWVDPVRDWVCYAAPIHAPDGTQVGAIDLSTTWKHANPLALSTVASMARLVEHELRNSPHLFGPAPGRSTCGCSARRWPRSTGFRCT